MLAGSETTMQQTRLPRLVCMVPVARRWVRALFAELPCARDAELIVSELVSNTLRYGRGPEFTVTVAAEPGHARLTVTDSGHLADTETYDAGASSRILEPAHDLELSEDEPATGRDLQVVNALASGWGHILDNPETLWAQLFWPLAELADQAATPDPDTRAPR